MISSNWKGSEIMFRIKTLNKISPEALSNLENRSDYQVGGDVESPDGILVRSANMHSMEMNDNLSCIIRAGAGYNNIPVNTCSEKGIVVFNTPGANANAVKELVICSLFLSSRNVIGGIEWAKTLAGKGDEITPLVEKGKSQFVGPEILGKTLGIVGLGAIGGLVANAAIGLGMKALGCDPYLSVRSAWNISRGVSYVPDYKTIYEQSDYISIHVPATGETKGMLNKDSFAVMKRGVVIINLARGELVNENDLIEAMDAGIVSHYVTDFPSERLIAHKNVIALPHLGASTPESEENCAEMAVKQISDFLEEGIIVNSVNYPNIDVPRSSNIRICVTHKNIPNVLSPLSGTLSNLGINICNLVNKSKGDYAYTLIDIDDDISDETAASISTLNGVLRVRVIR